MTKHSCTQNCDSASLALPCMCVCVWGGESCTASPHLCDQGLCLEASPRRAELSWSLPWY